MADLRDMLRSPPMAGLSAWFGNRVRKLVLYSLCLLVGLVGGREAMAETINVLTYHSHPPFVLGKGKGLTFDLANFLSERSDGRYFFKVSVVSRPRLNKIIEKKSAAIVPWVNPAWFGDKDESKFDWARGVLMLDGNAVLSRKSGARFDYGGPVSIRGKIVGGQRGHLYVGIDEFIKKTGAAKRVDSDTHNANIYKLRNGLIDLMLIPESAALYTIKSKRLSSELYVSATPHSRFQRRFMVLNESPELMGFIEQFLVDLSNDREWQKIVSRYR